GRPGRDPGDGDGRRVPRRARLAEPGRRRGRRPGAARRRRPGADPRPTPGPLMLHALSFLTIAGRAAPRRAGSPTPRALLFFPVVGALIGLAVGYAWWGAGRLWPPLVAGALALAIDAAIT